MNHVVSEIGQIAITVADVARSTAFYRDVLGLPLLFSAGPNLAFLAAGPVRLMLTAPPGEGDGPAGTGSVLYFKVPDADATHAALLARGATDAHAPRLVARMPDHALWIGFVRDPDGHLIGVMEERR